MTSGWLFYVCMTIVEMGQHELTMGGKSVQIMLQHSMYSACLVILDWSCVASVYRVDIG